MTDFSRYFEESKGLLIWKIRPRHHFKTDRAWSATNSNFAGRVAGTINTSKRSATNYIAIEINSKAFKAHRIVWEMHNGPIPDGYHVDHIDGNGINNRIDNLRLVDSVASAHNLPIQKSNTSGVVGVCWHKAADKWQARISNNGKRYDLGRFDSFTDAVGARKAAETAYNYHQNHGRA
jgi:hypothetical protein